jgi:hypothetical protein
VLKCRRQEAERLNCIFTCCELLLLQCQPLLQLLQLFLQQPLQPLPQTDVPDDGLACEGARRKGAQGAAACAPRPRLPTRGPAWALLQPRPPSCSTATLPCAVNAKRSALCQGGAVTELLGSHLPRSPFYAREMARAADPLQALRLITAR